MGDPISYSFDEGIYEYMIGYFLSYKYLECPVSIILIPLGLKHAKMPYWVILKHFKWLREKDIKNYTEKTYSLLQQLIREWSCQGALNNLIY